MIKVSRLTEQLGFHTACYACNLQKNIDSVSLKVSPCTKNEAVLLKMLLRTT